MSKDGAKIEKVVGKKKSNRYSRAECESEIARVEAERKNKDGVVVHGFDSKYLGNVRARLATLA